jgi:hypothetical protein
MPNTIYPSILTAIFFPRKCYLSSQFKVLPVYPVCTLLITSPDNGRGRREAAGEGKIGYSPGRKYLRTVTLSLLTSDLGVVERLSRIPSTQYII